MIDKKALEILKSTYWSPSGWRRGRAVSKEDLAYAKWAGFMFDPEAITHDEAVRRACAAVRKSDKLAVAQAFVESLESRRLDRRSALGSLAIGRLLPVHSHVLKGVPCATCNTFNFNDATDLSVLNFERHKWGGVRHYDPIYISLDLELFSKDAMPEPSDEAVDIFRSVIATARNLDSNARARDLERAIAGKFKSNKQEREVLLQILGYCGILEAKGKPGYFDSFVDGREREVPPHGKIDWTYPFAWWRGSDRVRDDALEYWFGGVV